jgi:hypothetical protein
MMTDGAPARPQTASAYRHDHHLIDVFPDATWCRLIDDSGLERVDVDDPDAGGT